MATFTKKKIKQKSGYYQSRFVGCSRLRYFLVLFMQFQKKKTIEILVTNNNTSSLRAWQKRGTCSGVAKVQKRMNEICKFCGAFSTTFEFQIRKKTISKNFSI